MMPLTASPAAMPVGPLPLISVQFVPPSVECQTWPTLTAPMVTQISLVLLSLNAIPEIHGWPGRCLVASNAGRAFGAVPLMFFQLLGPLSVLALVHKAPK